MTKKVNIILAISFIVYIFGFLSLHIFLKDRDFSEIENRKLEKNPKFSFEKLKEGKYTKDFESYVEDQFPMRDDFVAIKSYSELLIQRKDNNGVFIGSEGYFLQKFDKPDMNTLESNIKHINKFSQSFNTYFMLVPTATKIHEDKLPKYAQTFNEEEYILKLQNKLNGKVNFVPLLDGLKKKSDEYIYYKTDHHWTTLGAYYGYVEFCNIYGIKPISLDSFNIESTNKFYGSLFSKGNFSFAKEDIIDIYNLKEPNNVKVNYLAEDKTTNTLYEKSNLKKKDKYSVFLDNNHPIIKINSSVKNGKKLMVVKDSYANCLIPFLTNNFEEIHVMDLRFLNMPIGQYAKDNNINDVLLLYNVQNFSKEGSLSWLR